MSLEKIELKRLLGVTDMTAHKLIAYFKREDVAQRLQDKKLYFYEGFPPVLMEDVARAMELLDDKIFEECSSVQDYEAYLNWFGEDAKNAQKALMQLK